jgi:haloacetate dehalogenase
MLDDFEASTVRVRETSIFLRRGGNGKPLVLLHGFPETHLMWHRIAAELAERPLGIWRAWATDVSGRGVAGGHFFPEQNPAETEHRLSEFFLGAAHGA